MLWRLQNQRGWRSILRWTSEPRRGALRLVPTPSKLVTLCLLHLFTTLPSLKALHLQHMQWMTATQVAVPSIEESLHWAQMVQVRNDFPLPSGSTLCLSYKSG